MIHSGKAGHTHISQMERSGVSRKSSTIRVVSHTSHGQHSSIPENHVDSKVNSGQFVEDSLWLGPRRDGGKLF